MYKYKIVASDLDGTLFDNNARVSEKNANAIRSLNEKGILFVPSTGRTYGDISEELRSNENIRYFICSNGALVFDKETGNSIKNGIDGDLLKKALDILYEYDVHISIRTDGVAVTDATKYSDKAFLDYNLCPAHIDVLKNFAKPIEGFKEFAYKVQNAEALSTFYKSIDDLFECQRRLNALGGLWAVRQFEYNLDVCNSSTSKGDALMALADLLGIDRAATIGVGDNDNDISLIEAAGIGLAVSNSSENLKMLANKIICSNEEGAIDYIDKNYF